MAEVLTEADGYVPEHEVKDQLRRHPQCFMQLQVPLQHGVKVYAFDPQYELGAVRWGCVRSTHHHATVGKAVRGGGQHVLNPSARDARGIVYEYTDGRRKTPGR